MKKKNLKRSVFHFLSIMKYFLFILWNVKELCNLFSKIKHLFPSKEHAVLFDFLNFTEKNFYICIIDDVIHRRVVQLQSSIKKCLISLESNICLLFGLLLILSLSIHHAYWFIVCYRICGDIASPNVCQHTLVVSLWQASLQSLIYILPWFVQPESVMTRNVWVYLSIIFAFYFSCNTGFSMPRSSMYLPSDRLVCFNLIFYAPYFTQHFWLVKNILSFCFISITSFMDGNFKD